MSKGRPAPEHAQLLLHDDGSLASWNATAIALFGFDNAELRGRPLTAFVSAAAGGVLPTLPAPDDGVLRVVVHHKDGRRIAGELLAESMQTAAGARQTLVRIGVNSITDGAAARSRRRADRSLRLLREVNHAIVTADDESRLLTTSCDLAASIGGYLMACIGVPLPDEHRSVAIVAAAGLNTSYLETADIHWSDDARGNGPTGTAIRERRVVVNNDTRSESGMNPWRDDAIARGFLSSAAVPLVAHGELFGALALYAEDAGAFDEDELALLEQIGADIAWGIAALRERGRAERTLKESARLERLLSESQRIAHIASWEFDPASRRLFWTDQMYDLLGGDPSERIETAAQFAGLFVPEDQQNFTVWLDQLAAGLPLGEIELRTARTGAQARFVLMRGELEVGKGSRERKVIGTAIDVSQIKTIEQKVKAALTESRRFRDVLDQVPAYIYLKDAQSRYQYANKAILDLVGCSASAIVGKDARDFFPPETVAQLSAADRRALGGEQTVDEICVVNPQSGATSFYLDVKTPITDPDAPGTVWGLCGISTDITERKIAQSHLESSARRAHALLELPRQAETLDEKTFMQLAVEHAETLTGSVVSFIHFVNDDDESLELITWSKNTLENYCHAAFENHYPVSQAGIWADAIREMRPVIFNDYPACPHRRGLPEGHSPLSRFISIPVIENGRVVMITGVGNKPSAYDDQDVETVQLVSNEIWRIVQHRRSVERLRQSELRLSEAQAMARLGHWQIDRSGAGANWSSSIYQILGVPETDNTPRFDRYATRFTHESWSTLARHLQRCITDGTAFECDVELSSGGIDKWVTVRGLAVRDATSQLAGARGTIQDISSRKRAELAVARSEELMHVLMDQAPMAMAMLDRSMRYVAFTQQWRIDFGITEANLVGRSHYEFFHDIPDEWRDEHLRALDGEHILKEEDYFRHADGREQWLRRQVRPWYHADATVGGIVLSSEDLTERVKSQQLIRKLSLAIEQSPASVVITDTDGHIEYVNPAFLAATGYLREDVLGKNPRILQSGKTPQSTYTQLWDALQAGQAWQGEFVNRDRDGEDYVEFAHIAPLRQADGRITHYVAVKENITEKKQMGYELDLYRLNLEHMVETRTQQLAEEKARAEEAGKAKSRFLANMSHELRTPLNAVLGFAQIAYREVQQDKARLTLRRIIDAGQLLSGIINDILDFSKIEAGKLELLIDVVDLRSLIEQCRSLVTVKTKQKGLVFTISADEGLPASFHGDALRLTQVLGNLLSNAVKFTEKGMVELAIKRDGDTLHFAVRDTGIGIDADQLARLYQPFEQLDASATRKFGGTGLGLSISRRLVLLMGGTLQASSTRGVGSCFEIAIPLRHPEGHFQAAANPLAAVGEATVQGQRLTGLAILAAEDNDVNRLVLDELLSTEGCSLHIVEDGALAVDAIRAKGAQAYDLVLMDLQMPVMDGYEATRQIHALAPDLPIIGLTAHALEEERRRCLEAGMVSHVAKPFDIETLIACILKHCLAAEPRPHSPPMAATPAAQPAATPKAGTESASSDHFRQKLTALTVARLDRSLQDIRAAAARADGPMLATIAHSIKGMAGDLIPADLRLQASRVESAGRAGEANSVAEALAFSVRIEEVLMALRAVREATPQPAATAQALVLDWSAAGRLLDELETLISESDTRAAVLLDDNHRLLQHACGKAADTLREALDLFDFGAAQHALETMRRHCKDHLKGQS
ncbi:PAS domain S-box protein [Niveibacterium sp. 24ML]|uniref:PAS domain S-box protein n=1 Tax=Niveibacterium sp. 24ML TaxID=2985512 RepID=UPI00226EF72B|nr:PAS domain S-box protein [Niveibacterium sp. 24ML]MCX9157481.1 PAS domain S-box protein [Niveibacterium sp. 24ML]